MSQCYVFIYLPGEVKAVPAGIYSYDEISQQGSFVYGDIYRTRNNALPVDPVVLPLEKNVLPPVLTNGGLYGAFRDASPDYWGRTVIAHDQGVPASSLSEMDFLMLANASRVGNLDFRADPESPEPEYGPPSFHELSDLIDAAERLQQDMPIDEHQQQLLEQGTSMGGARPKCTVEWDDQLWIAKFPSHGDDFDNTAVEYATMTLAKKCGIDIAEVRLQKIGERNLLLVRRFDRRRTDNGFTRIGFMSALSFMEWDQDDRTQFSYVTIAENARQRSPNGARIAKELFKRMTFNWLCRNTDDHPRNHGFLMTHNGLDMSPAYDITPSTAKVGINVEFRLAMDIGDGGREATKENILSSHAKFGLTPDDANSIVNGMIQVVAGWEDHFRDSGVSDADIEKFRGSFDKGGV